MQDKEMIHRAKCGDKESLGLIVEKYYNDIFLFLCRKSCDRFYAEDLTQEVFLKFTQSLPQYKEKNKLKAYLMAIAVNCSNDFYRNKNIELNVDEVEFPDSDTDLENNTVISIIIEGALNKLPPEQKDIVILRYYHDLKIKEIAEILCVPSSTVKTRLYRAEKTLKILLKGEGEND